jgi:hypothetical protein
MMTETMMATTLRAHLHPPQIFCANFSNTDAPQRREVKGMNTPSQADTAAVANQLARLITAGTTEGELIAAVTRQFPDLERREFVAALQDATAAADKRAVSKH